jgi:SulP family sulfate permease
LRSWPSRTLRDAETCQHRTCDEIALIRFDAELCFEDKIMGRVALKSGLRYVIVVGDGINHVDASREDILTHLEAARQ